MLESLSKQKGFSQSLNTVIAFVPGVIFGRADTKCKRSAICISESFVFILGAGRNSYSTIGLKRIHGGSGFTEKGNFGFTEKGNLTGTAWLPSQAKLGFP